MTFPYLHSSFLVMFIPEASQLVTAVLAPPSARAPSILSCTPLKKHWTEVRVTQFPDDLQSCCFVRCQPSFSYRLGPIENLHQDSLLHQRTVYNTSRSYSYISRKVGRKNTVIFRVICANSMNLTV